MAAEAAAPSKARFGVLSTAAIAHKVVAAMHDARNAEVIAVASRSLEKAEAWAKAHDVPKAYGSYDELIAADDIDVIYIPLPTALKKDWAIKCAKAGKSIILEKPLPGLTDATDLEEIVAACEESNVQFFDGSMWQHSTRTKEIRARLEAGEIGAIRRVDSGFTFNPEDEEWLNGGNGRTDKTREPMGCFGDQGWYPISAIMFAMGYDMPSRVQMVSTTLNKVDTVVASGGILWWADGRWATFDCGATAAHRSYYHIAGEKGVINVEDLVGGQGKSGNFGAYGENFTGSGSYKMDDVKGKESVMTVEECNHTALMVEDMADTVLAKKPDPYWPTISLATHRTMAALWRSFEAGHTVVEM